MSNNSDVPWSAESHPSPREAERDGTNPIEQFALRRMQLEVASMRANFLMHLRLFPTTITTWAGPKRGQAYNTLGRKAGRVNRPMRKAMAHALDYPVATINAVIDGTRRPSLLDKRLTGIAPSEPTENARTGKTAFELDTVAHVQRNLGAFPASWLFRICVWPLDIGETVSKKHLKGSSAALYHVLSAKSRTVHPERREAVAAFLEGLSAYYALATEWDRKTVISTRALDQLLEGPRAPAAWTGPVLRHLALRSRKGTQHPKVATAAESPQLQFNV